MVSDVCDGSELAQIDMPHDIYHAKGDEIVLEEHAPYDIDAGIDATQIDRPRHGEHDERAGKKGASPTARGSHGGGGIHSGRVMKRQTG